MSSNATNILLSFFIGIIVASFFDRKYERELITAHNEKLTEIQIEKEKLRSELIIVISNDEKEIKYLNTLSVDSLILYCESAGSVSR
jgi:accessory colonization factor AcfC